MKAKFRLNTFAATDLGQTSDNNEDSILCQVADNQAAALLVVADGMGGHLAGEQASHLVIETIADAMQGWLTEEKSLPANGEEAAEQIAEALHMAVQQANQNVFNYAQENLEEGLQMGSTAACAFIQESVAALANVGDSRIYLHRQGQLYRLTEDHSLVERFVKEGIISDDGRYDHPSRNVVTRAIGPKQDVDIDLFTLPLQANDLLLLCSDGLWEMLRGDDIITQHLQSQNDLATTGQNLINAANQAGGEDNISVILAQLVPN